MLSSCRVLVVEDEPLVAEHLQDLLTDAEAIVVGPISTMAAARQLVRNGTVIDVALLDLNLGNGSVTPLLETLAARRVPTLVYTGAVVPEAVRTGIRTSSCSQSQVLRHASSRSLGA